MSRFNGFCADPSLGKALMLHVRAASSPQLGDPKLNLGCPWQVRITGKFSQQTHNMLHESIVHRRVLFALGESRAELGSATCAHHEASFGFAGPVAQLRRTSLWIQSEPSREAPLIASPYRVRPTASKTCARLPLPHHERLRSLGGPGHTCPCVFVGERQCSVSLPSRTGAHAGSPRQSLVQIQGDKHASPILHFLQALDLGSLEFEKEVSEDGVVTVWQTTYPRFDKYVPNGVVKLAQKLVGNKLVYTDILTYDSKKLQTPPFEIGVTSIAPVFQDKVSASSISTPTSQMAICRMTPGLCHMQVAAFSRASTQ